MPEALPLTGKKAVVTAASEGLGFGCAQGLAKAGADVVICSRSEEKLEKAVKALQDCPGKISTFCCDLLDEQSIAAFIGQVNTSVGAPDILVISTHHPPTLPFSKAEMNDWQTGHDLTLRPVMLLGKAWLPAMQGKKYGRLIVIGSIFGKEHEESSVIQSTYRAGLQGMIKCIAREYAKDGISANVINPGYFETPLVHNLAGQYAQDLDKDVQAVLDDWQAFSPAGRYGRLEELGGLVSYLASESGGFVNGEAVTIDGAATRSN